MDTFETNPLFLHWEEGSEQKDLESLHCLFQKFKCNYTYQCVYVGAVHMGHGTCVVVRSQYSGVGSHLHHELQALNMTHHPAIPLALMSYTKRLPSKSSQTKKGTVGPHWKEPGPQVSWRNHRNLHILSSALTSDHRAKQTREVQKNHLPIEFLLGKSCTKIPPTRKQVFSLYNML